MRIVTGVPLLVLALCTTLAMATPVSTTTPLSYSTTFTDPSGTPQSVSFTGTASGTSLTGTQDFLDHRFVRLVYEAPERNVGIGKSGRVRRGVAGARV